MREIRLLYIGGGPLMPASQPMEMLKYEYLGKYFSGDIITSILHQKHKTVKSIGNFRYHPVVFSGNSIVKNFKLILVYFSKALKLFRKNGKYDVIIAHHPLLTGLIALTIGKITSTPVIIEVNGNFETAFKFGRKGEIHPPFSDRLKEMFSNIIIPFVLKRADMVKLLSDNQVEAYKLALDEIKARCFSNFVPVQKFIKSPKNDLKYILLLGYPWYLKGVDILIKAFNMISHDFPEYRLKIFGWCPEGQDYYKNLAQNNHRIELNNSVYYEEVVPIMANCSLYVLASRTEAMGRVLIEAMACRKPIIASNVGGVYSIVKDGYNGLLFEKENVNDLAEKIHYLLSHPEVADRLSENGYREVQEHLSEENYINRYRNMIYDTLGIEYQ